MVACSARNKKQTTAATDLVDVFFETSEVYLVCLKINSASHRVHHALGLLENLLLHERAEVACETQHHYVVVWVTLILLQLNKAKQTLHSSTHLS